MHREPSGGVLLWAGGRPGRAGGGWEGPDQGAGQGRTGEKAWPRRASSKHCLTPRAPVEAQNQRVTDSCLVHMPSSQAYCGALKSSAHPRSAALAAHGATHRTVDSQGHRAVWGGLAAQLLQCSFHPQQQGPPSRSRVARPVTSLPQIFPESASGLHPRPPATPTSLTPQAKAGLWGSFHRPWIQGCSQGSIQSGPNTYIVQTRTPMFKFLGNSEAQNTREGRKKEPQNQAHPLLPDGDSPD